MPVPLPEPKPSPVLPGPSSGFLPGLLGPGVAFVRSRAPVPLVFWESSALASFAAGVEVRQPVLVKANIKTEASRMGRVMPEAMQLECQLDRTTNTPHSQ